LAFPLRSESGNGRQQTIGVPRVCALSRVHAMWCWDTLPGPRASIGRVSALTLLSERTFLAPR